MPTNYRRTPFPHKARAPMGWLALCLVLLFSSPFLGFAMQGKVDEAGLVNGLCIAVLPLLALTWLVVQRWRHLRQVPPAVLDEWRLGRVVPAEGAPAVAPPVRFASRKNWLELGPEGLTLAGYSVLSVRGAENLLQTSWVVQQAGQFFVPWADIAEWAVDSDGDGPDYHCLQLRPRGTLRVRRFHPDAASECDLLDAVRSVGRVPVRLRCDVDCEPPPSHPVK
jgi:hypothetical protein